MCNYIHIIYIYTLVCVCARHVIFHEIVSHPSSFWIQFTNVRIIIWPSNTAMELAESLNISSKVIWWSMFHGFRILLSAFMVMGAFKLAGWNHPWPGLKFVPVRFVWVVSDPKFELFLASTSLNACWMFWHVLGPQPSTLPLSLQKDLA